MQEIQIKATERSEITLIGSLFIGLAAPEIKETIQTVITATLMLRVVTIRMISMYLMDACVIYMYDVIKSSRMLLFHEVNHGVFMYQSNRSFNIPPGIPRAFDAFYCPGGREFDHHS